MTVSHNWHFRFCKILENFSEENVLINPTPWFGRGKKTCDSSCSRIANLAMSSAVLTSNTEISTKFNKFKLWKRILFNNICLTTYESNFFRPKSARENARLNLKMYIKNQNSVPPPSPPGKIQSIAIYSTIKLAMPIEDLWDWMFWIWSSCDEKLQNTKLPPL